MNFPRGRRMSWHKSAGCGCKINLRLKVTAKRPDGFHELSTLFYPLDEPGDMLEVSGGTPGMSLRVPGFPELENEKNLVWRAAEAYSLAAGVSSEWHFVLHKKTPFAAGLGGGSADAGAVLKLLNDHYQALSPEDLSRIALPLGADVPFFLERKAAWATGVGEKLEFLPEPVKIPEVVIVFPGFPVSAKWAYTHLAPEYIGVDGSEIKESFKQAFSAPESADWQSLCRNDLAFALWKKFPLLRIIREELIAAGAAAVQVSGSGSSLFALFHRGAVEAADRIRSKFGNMAGFQVFPGRDSL